ncbi:MAG: monovalent cation/H+ antiporter subunit D family protein [Alphaproteobacteria bacterium]|nr:monovalent cation/H+ antiporter subunit D family protein [Alphaproteobacteria bacterium]
MSIDTALKLGILAPLITAILVPVLSVRANWRDAAGPIGAVITFIAALHVAGHVRDGGTAIWTLIEISPGLSLTFKVTPLGAMFGLVASGLWILAALYTTGYMRGNHEKHQTRFAACYAIAVHAAMAIAWSGNLLVLFIFYEILTFSTYPLVTHKESREAIKAGRIYMSILVGTSLMLLLPAIIWVWITAGTLDFTDGGILAGTLDPSYAPWLMVLFAYGVGKAALMPIHRWLPNAMVAPTPVSALLHAVAVVKAGVFTVLMVIVYIFGLDFLAATGASTWLVWVAAFTILASSIIAMTKDDIKARLAYSTISQLSYIVLGAALATAAAIEGAALHIVMHASAKITLFFCAGAIYVNAHLNKVSQIDGLGPRMPLVFIAYFLGALSIIGVPPLGGSWSKFLLMAGAVDAGLPIIVAVLAVSSLLNVYYLLEPVFRAFFRPTNTEIKVDRHLLTILPPVITAGISIALFFAVDLLTPLTSMMVMP